MSARTVFFALCFFSLAPAAHADALDFALGKALFDRIWTPAPASTDATDGLGPHFDARSCAACHKGGGRGTIPGNGLVLRLGDGSGKPDPVYGVQFQTRAVQMLPPEGRLKRHPDGSVGPHAPAMGPLAPRTRAGGRFAPALFGAGLLERVPVQALIDRADPDDHDGDGVSGRINWIETNEGRVPGRFGWKAGQPTVRSQSAIALHLDVGLSNPLHPDPFGDCTDQQSNCRAAPHGASARFDNLEVSETMLDLIVTYVAGLPPPPPSDDADGLALFEQTGCAACHAPALPLDDGTAIAPYSDLLVHDMGDGLADGIGEHSATGREWRTPPLWGLRDAARFLHDGRARTIDEALSYHDGEAAKARQAYQALSGTDRARLLQFLQSL